MAIPKQDKLDQALHKDCGDRWALRVNDPCNATKFDQMITLLGEISNGGGGGSGVNQILMRHPFSVASGQENTWVNVPVVGISLFADVTVFDSADYEELFIDIRLRDNATLLDIRSRKPETFTIHIEGYA